jgi:hypothetical protein
MPRAVVVEGFGTRRGRRVMEGGGRGFVCVSIMLVIMMILLKDELDGYRAML